MALGDRINQLRRQEKLTQKALASKLNIPHQNLSNYEREFRQPDYETLQKIADYFEVTTDYLLGRSNTPHKTEEEEFQAFINDPELEVWYKELPKNKESELRRLKKMWDLMKNDDDQ